MTKPIPAIPTTSQGVNFRSRLEARWAEMFTLLGWRWTYEPIDLDGYIPDFLLHFPQPVLVEVKPAATWSELEEYARAIEPRLGSWDHEALVVGCCLMTARDWTRNLAIGLLAERWHDLNRGEDFRNWSDAPLFICDDCRLSSFCHDTGFWMSRACGHYSGNTTAESHPKPAFFEGRWRRAGNHVQWKGDRT